MPHLRDRRRLVADVSAELGFPAGDRVYSLLRTQYWWRGMREECARVAREALPRQLDRTRFPLPPWLCPTFKGKGPA